VEDLRQFTPQAGTGLGNPIDTSADVYWDPPLFGKTVRVVADSGEVDIILVVLGLIYSARRLGGQQTHTEQIEAIVEACEGTDKPIAVVLRTGNTIEAEGVAFDLTKQCLKAGFPVFPSVARAAEAMAHLISCNASRGAGS